MPHTTFGPTPFAPSTRDREKVTVDFFIDYDGGETLILTSADQNFVLPFITDSPDILKAEIAKVLGTDNFEFGWVL